jgi:hypothetical protein
MLPGFQACLAAMLALPNCRVWLHAQLESADLACVGLMAWSHSAASDKTFKRLHFFLDCELVRI